MMEIISKITIAEVVLLFNLVFVLPVLSMVVLRLRRYEKLYGELPEEPKKSKKKKKKKGEADNPAGKQTAEEPSVYQFSTRIFMTPPERSCLRVMREVLGPDVDVFPKVALWETVDPIEKTPENVGRLHGKDFDFLVCDKKTGQPLTAVMFRGGRGRPAGQAEELTKICEAAGSSVIFIDMAEDYNAKKMKDALRIPDLDLD